MLLCLLVCLFNTVLCIMHSFQIFILCIAAANDTNNATQSSADVRNDGQNVQGKSSGVKNTVFRFLLVRHDHNKNLLLRLTLQTVYRTKVLQSNNSMQ